MDIERAIALLQKSKTPFLKQVHGFPVNYRFTNMSSPCGDCGACGACGDCGGACRGIEFVFAPKKMERGGMPCENDKKSLDNTKPEL